jgi:hypothetical protein
LVCDLRFLLQLATFYLAPYANERVEQNNVKVKSDGYVLEIIERVKNKIAMKNKEKERQKMNKKIETKDKRQITKDWLSRFPAFKEYKPMWLIRRNGAFLCGIHLQRRYGNINYEPIFHIYNLMIELPVIAFGAATYLLNNKGARDRVTLVQHKENFGCYAERLKQQVSLLQKDTFSCQEFLAFLKKTSQDSIHHPYPSDLFQDIALALFWRGRIAEAEQEIKNAKKIISQWDEIDKQQFNGESGWEQQVRQLMNMDILKANVERQLHKYKLESFADFQLVC